MTCSFCLAFSTADVSHESSNRVSLAGVDHPPEGIN